MLDQLIIGLHLLSLHDGNHAVMGKQCPGLVWTKPDREGRMREVPCGDVVLKPAPNNDNAGLYVRHASGWGLGYVHRNSERHESFHVDWTRNVWKNLDITLGGATGYERASVVPIVAPSLRFNLTDKATARVVYLPGLGGSREALHLAAEVNWR